MRGLGLCGAQTLRSGVYIEGAEPGDVLEVRIFSIDLTIDYGYNGCSGVLPENCEPGVPVRARPAQDARRVRRRHRGPATPVLWQHGRRAAAGSRPRQQQPPGRHAGNLDNRELVAGSTLYIPVFARGALFEVGDGHVAEGDGEVDRMATDPDLLIATKTAIQEMVDFLIAEKHLTRHEAYQLVSTAGNVAVTQLVDKPNVAVHVRLPNSLFVAD
jgi:acetamidase/formamidase